MSDETMGLDSAIGGLHSAIGDGRGWWALGGCGGRCDVDVGALSVDGLWREALVLSGVQWWCVDTNSSYLWRFVYNYLTDFNTCLNT